ncbi:MAG: glycosyltransferase family 2 protein [Rikenellaceae bacterium]
MESLISVVVPIYNVEPYIVDALNSVVMQSYRNLEIILVDDGSPDRCGEICDDFAKRDPRIKVYHIPNGGVAKARQLGVESATGEYIAMVDPDDILPLDAIERLYSNVSDDVDMVIGSSTRFYESGKVRYVRYADRLVEGDEWRRMIITLSPDYVATPWARIYRRGLFTKDSFPVLKRGQDWIMNIELSARMRRVKMISDVVYNYRSPFGTGRTHKVDLEHTKRLLGVAEQILIDRGIAERYQDELHTTQLNFICKCIHNRAYIDCRDEWVVRLCRSVQLDRLSSLHRGAVRSLRSVAAQRKFRRRIKLKELTHKIGRWICIYTKRQPRQTT